MLPKAFHYHPREKMLCTPLSKRAKAKEKDTKAVDGKVIKEDGRPKAKVKDIPKAAARQHPKERESHRIGMPMENSSGSATSAIKKGTWLEIVRTNPLTMSRRTG